MKLNAFLALAFLAAAPSLQAAPKFWDVAGATPTPPAPPPVEAVPAEYLTATPTPVLAPVVEVASPTPTPLPGLRALNPTVAVVFSAILPGSGQVYAGDPLKGILFAAVFGVGLWQTIDNLRLVPDVSSGGVIAKNETAGNLFGLVTLGAYGFGIQDAYSTAVNYNKKNHLTLSFGISPRPNASLAFRF